MRPMRFSFALLAYGLIASSAALSADNLPVSYQPNGTQLVHVTARNGLCSHELAVMNPGMGDLAERPLVSSNFLLGLLGVNNPSKFQVGISSLYNKAQMTYRTPLSTDRGFLSSYLGYHGYRHKDKVAVRLKSKDTENPLEFYAILPLTELETDTGTRHVPVLSVLGESESTINLQLFHPGTEEIMQDLQRLKSLRPRSFWQRRVTPSSKEVKAWGSGD